MKKMIMIIAIIIFTSGIVSGSIRIDAGLYQSDLSVFFIDDFDLTQTGTGPLIFYVNITNDFPDIRLVQLKLSILYDGLDTGETELAYGVTETFSMQPGMVLNLTNRNLYTQGDLYRLQDYDINDDAAEPLINQLLASGRLPSGTYRFILSVTDMNPPNQVYQDEIILDVSNPTSLDLIAPGQLAGSSDLMEIYTSLPFFQWESTAGEFEIRVCEKLSTHNSPEDVMTGEARLEAVVPFTSFQYPSASAYPLEEGKIYFWQVTAIVQSSSGPVRMPSEIWGFKVANISGGASFMVNQQLINNLMSILGYDITQNLFGENGALYNHSSTGIILRNGTSLTMEEFNLLVQKFLSGEFTSTGYSVE